jgi:hypothetical protein
MKPPAIQAPKPALPPDANVGVTGATGSIKADAGLIADDSSNKASETPATFFIVAPEFMFIVAPRIYALRQTLFYLTTKPVKPTAAALPLK